MSDTPKTPPSRIPLALLLGRSTKSRTKDVVHRRGDAKVIRVPCPDGSIVLIGLASGNRWVAEWRCLEADFRDSMIDRMATHVRRSKLVGEPHMKLVP